MPDLPASVSLQDGPPNRAAFEFHSEPVPVVRQVLAIDNFAEYKFLVYWSNPYQLAGLPGSFGEYASAEWTDVICERSFLSIRIRACLMNQANHYDNRQPLFHPALECRPAKFFPGC